MCCARRRNRRMMKGRKARRPYQPHHEKGKIMQGKVKWFSKEKGYGFITDEYSTDRHFSVRDIIGADLPSNGSTVEFEPSQGSKGPRAQSIRIIHQADSTSSRVTDDRDTCNNCGKKMVPRIITHRGEVQRSVCPFCGATHKDFGIQWGWIILFGIAAWLIYSASQWIKGLFG